MSCDADIAAWLATQEAAMLAELAAMVNTDSGSYDKAGAERVGEQIRRFLAAHNIAVTTIPGQRHGDCLRAVVGESEGEQRPILLLGHRDTVFPSGEAARRPFRCEGGRAFGPGVADMKGGIVMVMFVLAAFARCGGAPAPIIGLFTADEEVGSPEGRPVIESEARRARAVFNAEPGRPSGNIVTARKGGVFSVVEVVGKAAHAGGNFDAGISAIGEAAHKILALHALTDRARGITVNVGLIAGGQSVNTIAPQCRFEIDCRYVEPTEREAILREIEAIVARSFLPGTRSTLTLQGEFLPLASSPSSERLFALYRQAAAESGLAVAGEFSGGCADSGFTAAVGAPTLCGIGPVGGQAHSPDEYLEIASLVPRAQALARAICRLEQAGL